MRRCQVRPFVRSRGSPMSVGFRRAWKRRRQTESRVDQAKTMQRLWQTNTRSWRCQRTARARTLRSTSRPLRSGHETHSTAVVPSGAASIRGNMGLESIASHGATVSLQRRRARASLGGARRPLWTARRRFTKVESRGYHSPPSRVSRFGPERVRAAMHGGPQGRERRPPCSGYAVASTGSCSCFFYAETRRDEIASS